MTNYLIFFEAPADGWRVPSEDLVAQLAADWPNAKLVPAEEMGRTEMRDVGWTYAVDDAAVEGWAAKSGLGISVEGDDGLAMRFAAWYRGLVPDDIEVSFCDDMYTFEIDLPPAVSANEIFERYAQA